MPGSAAQMQAPPEHHCPWERLQTGPVGLPQPQVLVWGLTLLPVHGQAMHVEPWWQIAPGELQQPWPQVTLSFWQQTVNVAMGGSEQ